MTGPRALWTIAFGILALAGAGARPASVQTQPASAQQPAMSPDEAFVRKACAQCHLYPPPDVLPKKAWGTVAFEMAGLAIGGIGAPKGGPPVSADFDVDRIVHYYETRAPEALPTPPPWPPVEPGPVRFTRHAFQVPQGPALSTIANVAFWPLQPNGPAQIVAVEMGAGLALAGDPARPAESLRRLASIPNPCHTQAIDLDRDGRLDLLVANLGDFAPGDHLKGSVVWLRQLQGGSFQPITLAGGLPRVADVEAADFDGDGDLDLVVAAFGWREVGGVYLLENRTTDWGHPEFVKRELDSRQGAIHVPVADLNGDGRLDFVALFAQHYETVVAFLNDGKGGFRKETIDQAPHPAWGSSGISLVDLDGDGDLDVLVANGDMLDDFLLKPYHGIRWLENRGAFPFVPHDLATLPGVHRARAVDLDGDSDLDIVACAYVQFSPVSGGAPSAALAKQPSLVWLEQVAPGRFERHTLEVGGRHVSLDVGDYNHDGNVDILVGNFRTTGPTAVELWENLGEEEVIEFALVLTLLAQAEAPPRAAAPTQEPPPPVFGGEVEQVTVDAVVVDKQGNPVNGLTKEDFTVLDEGRPRQVVIFDLVDLPAGATPPAAAARARPRLATNLAPPGPPGRTFVIVFDNLHLSPLNAQRAKAAIASFLDKGSRAGDRIMLLATGGGAWWSTRLPEGRADLLAILKGLEGRRIPENAQDRLTDFEAVRISVYRDAQVAARVQDRLERYGSKARQDMQQSQQRQKDLQENQTPGMIDLYIESRANEAYLRLKSRMGVTFAALERALKPLSASRDRKAVLLVSEGFVMDNTQEGFNHVEEAARRANATLYFVDTRGLEGLSSAYSVEFGASLDERNLMSAIADVSQEGEGAAGLAHDTGGFAVRNVNDLTAGVSRIGRESSRYYLLGFNPVDIPLDGRFRKIEVKVRGKGLTVRARRGYYAPGTAAKAEKRPEKGEADLQVAFDAPGFLDAIPLRMTSYVMQETTLGRARVLMVADIDVSKLAYQDAEGKSAAVLDTLLAVAHRDSGEIHRDDQKVDLERRPGVVAAGPAWYQIVRDFDLTAGGYQAKLVVRDAQSRRIGTVAYEFEVPVLDQFRVSTPILTDAVQTPRGQSALLPVVLARRTFVPGDSLYCRFDVFGAEKDKAKALPRVRSGNLVRRIDGTVVSRTAPTWIEPTSLGALSRMLRISLGGFTPGDYELVLTVEDALGGKTSELVEPFRLEYPDARPAAAGR